MEFKSLIGDGLRVFKRGDVIAHFKDGVFKTEDKSLIEDLMEVDGVEQVKESLDAILVDTDNKIVDKAVTKKKVKK